MNFAIVAAAGKGNRFQGSVVKQLYPLKNKPILYWSLRTLEAESEINQIIVVYPSDEKESDYQSVIDRSRFKKIRTVAGGRTRFQSVWNGFKDISYSSDTDVVLIHDAARPLITSSLVKNVLRKATDRGSAVPILPISETVKEIEGDAVLKTLPRERLYLSQTPQGFQYGILKKAYEKISAQDERDFTDEAMMVERSGFVVAVVPGEKRNMKITDPGDLKIVEYYLRERG
jgi:2-C-methyl-D-erythritol 4-phosphate cytidylyltransferase